MYSPLVAWIVAAMLAWTLPAKQHDRNRERFEAIASDAISVSFSSEEEPIFSGKFGRTKTAVLLLSWASFESCFRPEVIDGRVRGDGDKSFGIVQVQPGVGIALDGDSWRYDTQGIHGLDLVKDTQLSFRVALHMLRESWRDCAELPDAADRFSIYTSGSCVSGERASERRYYRALEWVRSHAPPGDDQEVWPRYVSYEPVTTQGSGTTLR